MQFSTLRLPFAFPVPQFPSQSRCFFPLLCFSLKFILQRRRPFVCTQQLTFNFTSPYRMRPNRSPFSEKQNKNGGFLATLGVLAFVDFLKQRNEEVGEAENGDAISGFQFELWLFPDPTLSLLATASEKEDVKFLPFKDVRLAKVALPHSTTTRTLNEPPFFFLRPSRNPLNNPAYKFAICSCPGSSRALGS